MYKNLLAVGMLLTASAVFCESAQAQLFKNARQNRQNALVEKGRASLDHVPYTAFGRAIKSRWDSRVHRIADRTGKSPEEIRGRRMRNLEMFGAALSGAADGLSAASAGIGYSSPSITSPSRSGQGSSLPSNFYQQQRWNSYNRNYSRLPYHAAANGF